MDREFSQLLSKFRGEDISDEEMTQLEQRLRESREARLDYLKFSLLHSLLESYPPSLDEADIEDAIEGDRVVRLPKAAVAGWLALAACITLLCTLATQTLLPVWKLAGEPGNPIATLVLAEECLWKNGTYREGQRLDPGALELLSGTAVIRFDGGAELVLSKGSAVDLVSPAEADLIGGEVVIRAEAGAEGFILDTPSGELVDLGTEFTVRVDPKGETELHVHEGEVAVAKAAQDADGGIVAAGKAVRLPKDGGRNEVPLDAIRFEEMIARANPKERKDLMTAYEGFHVEEGEYKPWELKGGKGWAGPWRLRNQQERGDHFVDSSSSMKIAMSQMDIAWPLKGGQLGMLEMPAGSNIRTRKMVKPVEMDQWGPRFLSFLVTEPKEVPTSSADGVRSDIRITLRSSENYFGEVLSFGWGLAQQPRVSASNAMTVRATRSIPSGETVFCVAKITTRKVGKDEVRFRFYTQDDSLDLLEPAEWDITLTGLKQSASYDLLLLTSNSPSTRYIDEIRIGPSWRSVTPINPPTNLTEVNSRPPSQP
ncbi:MAG: FecR family protein [Verrucomicrobiota bacterium]